MAFPLGGCQNGKRDQVGFLCQVGVCHRDADTKVQIHTCTHARTHIHLHTHTRKQRMIPFAYGPTYSYFIQNAQRTEHNNNNGKAQPATVAAAEANSR